MLTSDSVLQSAPAEAPYRPLLEAMYLKNSWLLRPMLEFVDEPILPEYFAEVAAVDHVLRETKPIKGEPMLAEVMKGLQFHSMEFLKLQMQFAKTGEYKAKDYDTVYKEVYSSGDVMSRYLDGLLLTYIAWPNHYRLLRWYKEHYLAKAKPGRCLEIGPGHGWLALAQLQSHPDNTFLGLDISEHSVAYTKAVLRAAGIGPHRYRVEVKDSQHGLPDDAGVFDRIVIAEVVEHLARPDVMLRSAVKHSHKDTLLFITTVVNIEAIDHLFLLRTLEEVRDLMKNVGLRIVDELDMELKMNLKMQEKAYEVALVCTPA